MRSPVCRFSPPEFCNSTLAKVSRNAKNSPNLQAPPQAPISTQPIVSLPSVCSRSLLDDVPCQANASSRMAVSQSAQNITTILRDVFSSSDHPCSPAKHAQQSSPSDSTPLKFEDIFNFSPDAALTSPTGALAQGTAMTLGYALKTPVKTRPVHNNVACLTEFELSCSAGLKALRHPHSSPLDTLTNIMSSPRNMSLSSSDVISVS